MINNWKFRLQGQAPTVLSFIAQHDKILQTEVTHLYRYRYLFILPLVDPIYYSVVFHSRKGLTGPGEIKASETCIKCHTPVGFISGFFNTVSQVRNNPDKVPAIAKQGIHYDFRRRQG